MIQLEKAKDTKNHQNVLALVPEIFPIIERLLEENPLLK